MNNPLAVITVGVVLVLVLAPTVSHADAETDTDTGVVNSGPPAPALSPAQELAWQQKMGEVESLATALRLQELSGVEPAADSLLSCPAGDPCPAKPANYKIPAAESMTIHSQNKRYTCGPGSLRNMVLSMNKSFNGSYSAPAEATLESWLNTTSEGTWIEDIVRVLNSRFDQFGSWKSSDPADKHAYLASVVVDTYSYKQPLIQGVRTDMLAYFNGKRLNHFNAVYGYGRSSGTTQIKILEGWDPVKVYGSVPSYGNPYGHRSVGLVSAFEANHLSGNQLRRLIV